MSIDLSDGSDKAKGPKISTPDKSDAFKKKQSDELSMDGSPPTRKK